MFMVTVSAFYTVSVLVTPFIVFSILEKERFSVSKYFFLEKQIYFQTFFISAYFFPIPVLYSPLNFPERISS